MYLLFYDFQNLHGAGLDTDAAGNALGCRALRLQDHDLHGADLDALAAADTVLLADHIDTGLGVLGDGIVLTGLHALSALDADLGLGIIALSHDADAAQILIELLIESGGTSLNALQTCHAGFIFLNSELLHRKGLSFCKIF